MPNDLLTRTRSSDAAGATIEAIGPYRLAIRLAAAAVRGEPLAHRTATGRLSRWRWRFRFTFRQAP